MRVLANRERLHAVIAVCGGEGRILYRQDGATLYVTGPTRFDTDELRKRLDVENVDTTGYDNWLNNIQENASYRFTVTCAPVKTVQGRKVPLHDRQERQAWLARVLEEHGARLRYADISNPDRTVFTRSKQTVTFVGFTVQGILQVTNPSRFRDLLTNGMGKGRAYGYGMLTIG